MINRKKFLIELIFAFTLTLFTAEGNLVRSEWQEHRIRQGDGRGGWVTRPAQRQVLKYPESTYTMPFGLVQMDNGEIAIVCSREKEPPKGKGTIEPIIAFSKEGATNWTDFTIIAGASNRPMNPIWHGKGRLSFVTNDSPPFRRYFSNDYGRTWPEAIDHPPTKQGMTFNVEGNDWVDRDDHGQAKAILELGWHFAPGKYKSEEEYEGTVVFRRSIDGARTWIDEVAPPQWKFTVEHKGKKWLCGVHEGAIVRAANGDLVAALRTAEPPSFDDNLHGTAISISSDDGKTWSQMQFLFRAGRHHANLQRLPNGDLVCTLIVRNDIQDGKPVGHRRGCDALVSKDHGKTWGLDRRYELDSFDFLRADGHQAAGGCGHIGAIALPDGHVISAYGHYQLGASVLIKWQPDAAPAASH